MSKTLYFFTDQFPYGKNEAFIENEFPFLKQNFSKIIIIHSQNSNENSRIQKDKKIKIVQLNTKTTFYTYIQPLLLSFFYLEVSKIILNSSFKEIITKIKIAFRSAQNGIKNYNQIKKIVDKQDENYFYSYWFNDNAITVASLKKQFPTSKSLVRGHGWDVYFERNTANYLPFRESVLSNIDLCTIISQNGCNYLNEKTKNKYVKKIKVSRLGTLNNRTILQRKKDEKRFSLVTCSNIIPLKRLDLLIESLSKSTLSIHWTHFGTGSSELEIKSKASQKLQEKSNISYLFKGQITNKRLYDFYTENEIDLFVNLSRYEGIPVSIMEAFSFGIPCIATNVGGTSEIVSQENGMLIDVNSSTENICNLIESFLLQPNEIKAEISSQARKTWEEKYNAEKNYTEFITLLNDL
jgi:glycosyltransferase involved in cell wall biosynthesis